MRIVRSVVEVRAALSPLRGGPIGLVPTMGASHEGHLALFRAARVECDTVVASLFVNPTQFLEGEDFGTYPRDEDRDATLAAESGVDLLYAPGVDEVYPPGFQTQVEVSELSVTLEGAQRPGHFRGVATVCLKLFNTIRPERAYFGQKDAQQVAVVQRLVRDLDVGVEIVVVPTVRDETGLALSSRNACLSDDEREVSLALRRALTAGAAAWRARPGDATAAAATARAILTSEPRLAVDYAEVARFDSTTVLVGAIRVGRTRLIDNVVLDEGDLLL